MASGRYSRLSNPAQPRHAGRNGIAQAHRLLAVVGVMDFSPMTSEEELVLLRLPRHFPRSGSVVPTTPDLNSAAT